MELDNEIESQIAELQDKMSNRITNLFEGHYPTLEVHDKLREMIEYDESAELAADFCLEEIMNDTNDLKYLAFQALEDLKNSDRAQSLKDILGLDTYTDDELKILYTYEFAKFVQRRETRHKAYNSEEGYDSYMDSHFMDPNSGHAENWELLDAVVTKYIEQKKYDMYEQKASKGKTR